MWVRKLNNSEDTGKKKKKNPSLLLCFVTLKLINLHRVCLKWVIPSYCRHMLDQGVHLLQSQKLIIISWAALDCNIFMWLQWNDHLHLNVLKFELWTAYAYEAGFESVWLDCFRLIRFWFEPEYILCDWTWIWPFCLMWDDICCELLLFKITLKTLDFKSVFKIVKCLMVVIIYFVHLLYFLIDFFCFNKHYIGTPEPCCICVQIK